MNKSFVIIDAETTGLLENPAARVIELGWIVVEDHGAELRLVDSDSTFLRYRFDVWAAADPEALRVNGLDRATFENLAVPGAWVQAGEWFAALPMDWHRAVTGWNVQFDLEMLQRSGAFGFPIVQPFLDPSTILGRHLSRERCSLARASVWADNHGGLTSPTLHLHRALADCLRTLDVLQVMRAQGLL